MTPGPQVIALRNAGLRIENEEDFNDSFKKGHFEIWHMIEEVLNTDKQEHLIYTVYLVSGDIVYGVLIHTTKHFGAIRSYQSLPRHLYPVFDKNKFFREKSLTFLGSNNDLYDQNAS